MSHILNALVISFHVSGSKVLLGIDPWCGGDKGWKLSKGLVDFLKGKGLFTLHDVTIQNVVGSNVRWKYI